MTLALGGVGLALALDPLYALIVFAGLFFDVVVYTIWLKRRTAWSILWGGIAGGMPILAGRTLATGSIDWIGIVLALAVLFWIPTHIMTFSMRYYADYNQAGVPTFPAVYGFAKTRRLIAVSSLLAGLAMISAALGTGISWGLFSLLAVLSAGLLVLGVWVTWKASERVQFGLFKYASLYMFCAMLLFVVESV